MIEAGKSRKMPLHKREILKEFDDFQLHAGSTGIGPGGRGAKIRFSCA
jgi:hypothetical protein